MTFFCQLMFILCEFISHYDIFVCLYVKLSVHMHVCTCEKIDYNPCILIPNFFPPDNFSNNSPWDKLGLSKKCSGKPVGLEERTWFKNLLNMALMSTGCLQL